MNELTNLLEKLADKLGTTVEKLWTVLLKQTRIIFWEYIAYTILAGIFLIVAVYFIDFCITGLNSLHSFRGSAGEELCYAAGLILSIIYVIIAPFIIIGNVKECLTTKNNPEYWALQDLLTSIRKDV